MNAQPIPFHGLEDKQANRNRTHLPGGGELAALLRAGATIRNLIDRFDAPKATIYDRLRYAGYSPKGEAIDLTPKPIERKPEAPFITAPEPWTEDGSCVNHPEPDLWHADSRYQTRLAQTICGDCPARILCLEYAMRIESATGALRQGVWGGLTPKERKKIA